MLLTVIIWVKGRTIWYPGGGGLVFFLGISYFFSLFAKQVIFFKSKLQQVFYNFWKNNTIKSEKCKWKQHDE